MAHHSSNHDLRDQTSRLAKQLENRIAGTDMQEGHEETFKNLRDHLGATGEYPQGQYGPHDEGALRFGIAAADGKVLIDFGKSVRSIGCDPDQADALAQVLMEKARQARAQRG